MASGAADRRIDLEPQAGDADAFRPLDDFGDQSHRDAPPSRSTLNITSAPGFALVAAATSDGERTGRPSTATMRSPADAGALGRLARHDLVDQRRAGRA